MTRVCVSLGPLHLPEPQVSCGRTLGPLLQSWALGCLQCTSKGATPALRAQPKEIKKPTKTQVTAFLELSFFTEFVGVQQLLGPEGTSRFKLSGGLKKKGGAGRGSEGGGSDGEHSGWQTGLRALPSAARRGRGASALTRHGGSHLCRVCYGPANQRGPQHPQSAGWDHLSTNST